MHQTFNTIGMNPASGVARAHRSAAPTALEFFPAASTTASGLPSTTLALLNWHVKAHKREAHVGSTLATCSLLGGYAGLTQCRYMMGVILCGGKCGVRDEEIAVKYWRAAAAQGDVWSQFRLSTMTHITEPELDLTAAAAAPSSGASAPTTGTLSPRRAAAASLLRGQVCHSQHWQTPLRATVTCACRIYF